MVGGGPLSAAVGRISSATSTFTKGFRHLTKASLRRNTAMPRTALHSFNHYFPSLPVNQIPGIATDNSHCLTSHCSLGSYWRTRRRKNSNSNSSKQQAATIDFWRPTGERHKGCGNSNFNVCWSVHWLRFAIVKHSTLVSHEEAALLQPHFRKMGEGTASSFAHKDARCKCELCGPLKTLLTRVIVTARVHFSY